MRYSNLKEIFLDISSTYIYTLVPSLHQYVKTGSIEMSQPLPHFIFNIFVMRETFATEV
jgi:hypothetical protein